MKKQKLDADKQFLFLLIGIMVVQAIRYFPFKFGGWNQIMLSFSYRYGFIQRAFIGTILDIESTLFHIPLKYMRYIYGIFTVAFYSIVFLAIFMKAIKKQKDQDVQLFLKGLTFAFYFGPGWVSCYSNFAITDIWLALVAILSVYLVIKEKWIYLTVLLSIIGELIHPGYVFLFFNTFMIIVAYKALFKDNSKINKKYTVLFVINAIVTSAFFFVLFLFAHVREGITLDYVMERTAEFVSKSVEEIENHRYTIRGFLFRNGGESGIRCLIQSWGFLIVGMAIVFFPFFFEIYRYWHIVHNVAKQNKEKFHWFYGMIPFGVLTLIPVYIMQNDYGRWTYAGLIYEVAVIIGLLFMKDRNVIEGTKQYMVKVRENKWYYILLIAYAGICGAFEQNLITGMVSTVEQIIWKIIEFI